MCTQESIALAGREHRVHWSVPDCGVGAAAWPAAALALLVARYTRDADITLQINWEDAVTEECRSAALTLSLGDNPTVEQFLRRVDAAMRHADPRQPAQLAEPYGILQFAWRPLGQQRVNEPALTLTASFTGGAMTTFGLFGHAALCASAAADGMTGHLQTLLEAICNLPATPVERLPMLSEDETRTLLEDWSGASNTFELERDELLHHLFERQADARPQQPAIVCGERTLTYAQAEQSANRLARFLRRGGVGAGSAVGILLPRGAEVYLAMLAAMKAGAAYVPLDAEYPANRVKYILGDCKVHTVITTAALAARHDLSRHRVIVIDQRWGQIEQENDARLTRDETGAAADHVCYVIYTSGSTGRPKGVQIEHRSACNLVRAEAKIFGVVPADRVYQGFSVAFDASVEEIWLAFFAGATLVVGTAEMVHAGGELSRMLTDAGVTVLSCVPTLLSMMEQAVPTLRLLIVGGEACPQDLVRRWTRPGCRMVNTYGPTEATVIATWGDVSPDKPVTIGRAVPNYRVYILDGQLQPVPAGVPGELHIGGIGLSRGYVGRDDLTAEKFIPDPFQPRTETENRGIFGDCSARLYKTGDLVRWTADGEIEFLGRIDTQVKLRGFRIELSEIESALMQCPEVLSAVVSVYRDGGGIDQLVGYLIARPNATIDEERIKSQIRGRLAVYMVPALLEVVNELPTLPSGKVDRKRLPAPRPRAMQTPRAGYQPPRTASQKKLATAWEKLFGRGQISIADNFFMDLGGHSLLAAAVVSQLRHDPAFAELSVLDVYHHPTIEALAKELDGRQAAVAANPTAQSNRPDRATVAKAHLLCAAAQAVGLWVIFATFSAGFLIPLGVFMRIDAGGGRTLAALLAAAGTLLAMYPAMLLLTVAVKWMVLGRIRPGVYPLWGGYYLRWWFVNRVLSIAPAGPLIGTPLFNIYLRLLGARIGRNVHINSGSIGSWDLLSIGDDSSISSHACLLGYGVEDGMLKIGPITIGKRCFLGTHATVKPYARIENDGRLGDLSLLGEGTRLAAGQTWLGSPARPLPKAQELDEGPVHHSARLSGPLACALHAIGIAAMQAVYLLASLPGIMLMLHVFRSMHGAWLLAAAPAAAIAFVLGICLEIAALKWLMLGRVRPGRYEIQSWFYVRKWFIDHLMDMSLHVIGPIYASLYLPAWYRLLGAKLGRHAEVSTAREVTPDMLNIGDESFIADSVLLGAAHVEGGVMTLGPVKIGKRAFVGNSAVTPGGTVIGDRSLLGVLSAPPREGGTEREGTSWLGSPAIFLPQRQASAAFSPAQTFNPTPALYAMRAAIEFVRIILPSTCFILLGCGMLAMVAGLRSRFSLVQTVMLFPLVYLEAGLAAMLIVVLFKWMLMGRYKQREKPLWSTFVWRTELVANLQEHLADPMLVNYLVGTPWICCFFRLLGAEIGRRVYMESTELTEYDLVNIGDDACINFNCVLQTHLFEDRVMKMSQVIIGERCSAGAGSVVLYDSRMEAGSVLGDLSLLMKGESLPEETRWEGAPARRAPAANRAIAAVRRLMPAYGGAGASLHGADRAAPAALK